MPVGVGHEVHRLREVDDHQPLARRQDVVGRQVAVRHPVPGQLGHGVTQLLEVGLQQVAARAGLRQPRAPPRRRP